MKIVIKYLFLIIIIIGIFLLFNIKTDNIYKNTEINVKVTGNVKNDKTFKIPYGSTIKDIIDEIEFNNNDDINNLNLSKILYDGETIVIDSFKYKDAKISINHATKDELCTLEGIGEKTALKIIEYRENFGLFTKIEELMEVSGIGETKFSKIKEFITL